MSNTSVGEFGEASTSNMTITGGGTRNFWWESGRVQIPLYTIIFLLAVVGNFLVILTLVQHKRMRTITNVFLLNLAISDLMLGVLCMPFTLIGTILRDFVFGKVMCKLVPYLQACSVSVSVWTLVAISVERYYAICHPLRSRRWQTLSHSYRLIVAIWSCSLIFMSPISGLSELIPTSTGHVKCREMWPGHGEYERAYNLILDAVLLIVPLIVLAAMYTLVTRTLCKSDPMTMSTRETNTVRPAWNSMSTAMLNVRSKINSSTRCSAERMDASSEGNRMSMTLGDTQETTSSTRRDVNKGNLPFSPVTSSNAMVGTKNISSRTKKSWRESTDISTLRRANPEKALLRKKRVIKMLLIVVIAFFVCWTPLYVINTLAIFSPNIVYNGLGSTGISFFQLLAYSSSCCNPITYCFMNNGFRKSFLGLFKRCNCSVCTDVESP